MEEEELEDIKNQKFREIFIFKVKCLNGLSYLQIFTQREKSIL